MAFRRALRLDPELKLPSWVGPDVAETFERAKVRPSPSVVVEPAVTLAPVPDAHSVSVEAEAGTNQDGLARRLLLRVGERRELVDLGAAPLRFVMKLPASLAACDTVTASVLDEHGNELWPDAAKVQVCRPPPAAPPGPAHAADAAPAAVVLAGKPAAKAPGVSRAAWAAGAATGAALVATGVLGIVALERRGEYNDSLNDSTTTAGERENLRSLALTAEHRATGGAVVTGLLAAATVILYFRGRF
jgi:hypothetical protein